MKRITAECGHDIFIKNPIFPLLGETKIRNFLKKITVKQCPECIRKFAIKCAWCGGQILAGDKITLYTPISKEFEPPRYAVIYTQYPFLRIVGCAKRECVDKPEDVVETWRGQKMKVERKITKEDRMEEIVRKKTDRGLW